MNESKPAHYLSLPEFPKFDIVDEKIDGLIPACRVPNWRGFQEALFDDFFNRAGIDLIFRGHRRHEWPLTPTLGRYTPSGVIQVKQAEYQLDEFRLALRGRGANLFLSDDEQQQQELWAYGQHHGLATPLLDWTKSPFVALFFAFAEADPAHEEPNGSRPIFILNMTAIEALDENIIVQPRRDSHTRLINQAGLFTISPIGEETLVTRILDLIAETKIDMDNPQKVAEYICKIHIPQHDGERTNCMRSLKMMNIHHGTLFPDAIGASLYCNEWFGSHIEPLPPANTVIAPAIPAALSGELPTSNAESPRPAEPLTDNDQNVAIAHVLMKSRAEVEQSPSRANELAHAILETYSETAAIDWQRRPSSEAQIRTRFTRLLRSNGWTNEDARDTANELLEHFRRLVKSGVSA
ncbi:MAG: FRG domain-containing protein [Hyphomicrobiaceae bacterium]|nr:FRG domain-containing protein [Hyphomicrobiaceae bacterium]